MTDNEARALRPALTIEVLQYLFHALHAAMSDTSPAATEGCEVRLAAFQRQRQPIVSAGLAPEHSHVVAAEYQSALAEMIAYGTSRVRY